MSGFTVSDMLLICSKGVSILWYLEESNLITHPIGDSIEFTGSAYVRRWASSGRVLFTTTHVSLAAALETLAPPILLSPRL